MYLLILPDVVMVFKSVLFTSHYVSINSVFRDRMTQFYEHLHPTMYLLILNATIIIAHCYSHLHPTMYLLILSFPIGAIDSPCTFTSHYVSINSMKAIYSILVIYDLHPTMYLLIRYPCKTSYILILIYIPLCIY